MDAASSPAGLVRPTYQSTRRDISGDRNYHSFYYKKNQYIHKLFFHDTWYHHCDNGNPLLFCVSQLDVIDSINMALV